MAQELQNAPPGEPKAPIPYHVTWDLITPAGFHLQIERDCLGSDLAAVIKNFDASASNLGLKPPETPEFKIEMPTPAVQAQAASGDSLIMTQNDDGTWACPTHGIGKFVPPGTNKTTQKPYAGFWCCSVQGCKAKPPRKQAA